jgi:hypothetical protein
LDIPIPVIIVVLVAVSGVDSWDAYLKEELVKANLSYSYLDNN